MGGRAWGDPGSDNGGITRMRLDRERGVCDDYVAIHVTTLLVQCCTL